MSPVPRKLVRICAAILVATLVLPGAVVWFDNRPAAPVEPRRLATALDRALSWLDANRTRVSSDSNPALWWMLARADELLGGDPRLQRLIEEYKGRWMQPGTATYLWYPLFDRLAIPAATDSEALLSPAYYAHYFYGLTCDRFLSELEIVKGQNDADYCPVLWLRAPHCRTHQLMGLLWGLQRGCDGMTRHTAIQVRDAVWREELVDFRVDDAYIQRALLLAFEPSGAAPLRPVWVDRILRRQLPDGGWDEDDTAMSIGSNRYLMIGARSLTMRQPASAFHATAQAILLLARLLHEQPTTTGSSRLAQWASLNR